MGDGVPKVKLGILSFAGVLGTSMPGSAARPAASGTLVSIGASVSGSAPPGPSAEQRRLLLDPLPLRVQGGALAISFGHFSYMDSIGFAEQGNDDLNNARFVPPRQATA